MAEVHADDLKKSLEAFSSVEMLPKALYFWRYLKGSLIQT